jgi:uncharacterized membrane protein
MSENFQQNPQANNQQNQGFQNSPQGNNQGFSNNQNYQQVPTNNSVNPENDKIMAALGYVLFIIPMFAAPESKFAKFHANQGLILLIFGILVQVLGAVIPFIGWFLIWPIGSLVTVVYFLLGIVNAMGGKEERLPVIGNYDILK